MDAERWLRPRPRIALATAVAIILGFGLMARMVAGGYGVAIFLALGMGPIFAWVWLNLRRHAWNVGPEGVAVYRDGRRQRFVPWDLVTRLQLDPTGATVASAFRPFGDRILCLNAGDRAWLRTIAGQRLGSRSVG